MAEERMKDNNSGKGRDSKNQDSMSNDFQGKRRVYMRRKVCRFCTDKSMKIDYKHPEILRRFTTEGGKIIPRRISGNCAKHQRMLANAIKRARYIAFLPFVKK